MSRLPWLLLAVLLLSGCDSAAPGGALPGVDPGGDGVLPRVEAENCAVEVGRFADGGVPVDGIPALTNPALVPAADAVFLTDESRVIGLLPPEGPALAVPHSILWHHEIANFDFGAVPLAVTYCPLTGSSLAFDRGPAGGAAFGVSGLLFQNNLTMYDRRENASLWPQMNRAAGCGDETGTVLPLYPIVEMTWGRWRALHPETRVVSSETGFSRNYAPSGYPYRDYEGLNNPDLLDPRQGIDRRRPPKERALGIPVGTGGVVFPFGVLDETGALVRAVHETVGGEDVVVFWDERAQGAMAYRPAADGQALTFAEANGQLVDAETGSVWDLTGRAVEGPLAGMRLAPVAEAYVAFWFAWALFQPDVEIWEG